MILDDWILIQRNGGYGTINSYANWTDYENGFGNHNSIYWIGLRKMHNLTTVTPHRLAIVLWYQLENHAAADIHRRLTLNVNTYQRITLSFDYFAVGDADSKYALYVGGGVSDNEQLWEFVEDIIASNGTGFSTRDRDHDSVDENCALSYHGGWWYNMCEPNSFPRKMYGSNNNFISVKMKIKPKSFK